MCISLCPYRYCRFQKKKSIFVYIYSNIVTLSSIFFTVIPSFSLKSRCILNNFNYSQKNIHRFLLIVAFYLKVFAASDFSAIFWSLFNFILTSLRHLNTFPRYIIILLKKKKKTHFINNMPLCP